MKIVFIVLCLFSVMLRADILVATDGTIYKGTIRSATDSTITIADKTLTVTLNKSEVIAIHFSNADVVYLLTGEEIVGKVAAKENDEVIIATSSGVKRVSGSSVEQVKYNFNGEIKVTELPRTSKHFTNPPTASSDFKESSTSVFISLHVSNHYAALNDWQNQFTGGPVETQGYIIGVEAGYVPNQYLIAAVGYEGYSSPTVEVRATSPTFDDYTAYTFLYGSILAGGRPKTMRELFIYGGVDLGNLTGKEAIKNFNGLDLEASKSLFAFRVKGGVRYMSSNSFSMTTELGFLSAGIKNHVLLNTIALDFSGFFYRFGISFHIPTTTSE